MAPLVVPLFAGIGSIFSGGAAAGGAAAATGAAAAAGSSVFSIGGLGSLFATVLSGGATALSAMAAINKGKEQAQAYNGEADQSFADQRQETVEGRDRRDSLRKGLIQQLGDQDVAASASGLDLSFGTPAIARDEAKQAASDAISTDLLNESDKRVRLTQRETALRRMASDSKRAGQLQALGAGLDFGAGVLKRG